MRALSIVAVLFLAACSAQRPVRVIVTGERDL